MSFPLVDLLTIPSEMSSLPVMYDLPKRDTGRGERMTKNVSNLFLQLFLPDISCLKRISSKAVIVFLFVSFLVVINWLHFLGKPSPGHEEGGHPDKETETEAAATIQHPRPGRRPKTSKGRT